MPYHTIMSYETTTILFCIVPIGDSLIAKDDTGGVKDLYRLHCLKCVKGGMGNAITLF